MEDEVLFDTERDSADIDILYDEIPKLLARRPSMTA